MSADFVMQSGVLMPVVAREYEAFMVQVAAVGPLAEDCVADGSCGSRRSFDRGISGSSVEAVGSLEESWRVSCLQQSKFRQSGVWQLTFVGAVVSLMQWLHDLWSLMNADADADANADAEADTEC